MDRISLLNKITSAVANMVRGHRRLAVKGSTEDGLTLLTFGQDAVKSIFNEVIASNDASLMLDALMFYTAQEIAQYDAGEEVAHTSAETAMNKFMDASLALEAVKTDHYDAVDKAVPHSKNYRHNGLPRDSFHIACDSERMRIMKGLTEFGHSPATLGLTKARRDLVDAAQNAYCELQERALAGEK
jgi:hypothetical protein